MLKRLIFSLVLLSNFVFAQSTISKVIQLQYVQSDKVIQLIQPLLQPNEKISGSGQTIVVNVNPDTLTQIRNLIHQIDVPPVVFNVTIFQGDPEWLDAQNNNDVVYSTQPPSEVQRSQSVQVMNGESAFVSTGQEVPIVSSVGVGFFTGVDYQQHNIQNGLLVQPTLQGSQVKLMVRRVREQQNAAGGQQFDNQQIDTTIMAPLNKWVSLGTAEGVQDSDSNSTSYTAGRSFSKNSTLYIKVTVENSMLSGDSQ
ncbi:secretin N-terminal domain-containing protein [Legionella waltersii]|uniref:Type II/III secretion system protein n=1 Tax=Legionella waltersii TaxID=66969 RepID=A0A0W1ADH3_9GAMM|nr:secretin N-terminal domain-containing protein [Legionella waltersii]KTD79381.1 type II/III secretion system protein [Legionella waltersii]SNU99684.1 type II/III secretion system protein [Legionella waltersii]